MKKIINLFCVILALFTIFILSSCTEDTNNGITFIVDRTNMNMSVGDVYTVSWSVIPTPDEPDEVSWKSSNDTIVVCDGGVLRAVGEGRAIVTATHSSGAYDVISITVKNGNRKLYMLEGESYQLKREDINIALKSSACISSDSEIATISDNGDGIFITAHKKGVCDIKLETEKASIIYYDLVVLSRENSGVNIEIDEFPLVVNYDTGKYKSAVKITNISVEKRDSREFLDEHTVQVELVYDIQKIYDSDGDDSLNLVRFEIEVYSSDREGDVPIRTLEVHSGWITVESGEVKQFVYTFNVDFEVGNGERTFTFRIKEIEAGG